MCVTDGLAPRDFLTPVLMENNQDSQLEDEGIHKICDIKLQVCDQDHTTANPSDVDSTGVAGEAQDDNRRSAGQDASDVDFRRTRSEIGNGSAMVAESIACNSLISEVGDKSSDDDDDDDDNDVGDGGGDKDDDDDVVEEGAEADDDRGCGQCDKQLDQVQCGHEDEALAPTDQKPIKPSCVAENDGRDVLRAFYESCIHVRVTSNTCFIRIE